MFQPGPNVLTRDLMPITNSTAPSPANAKLMPLKGG
jgi:hypothetical protein